MNRVIKSLSPAQETECAEACRVRNMLVAFVALPLLCGTLLTLITPSLIKHIGGIESFGFPFWTWMGMHLAIFWVGAVVCTTLVIFLVWRIVSAFK